MADIAPTDLLNPPLASMTPEQAQTRYDDLKATPKFVERALANDPTAQEMLRDLYLIKSGDKPPSLRQPVNVGDVYEGMSNKEIELAKASLKTWAQHIHMTPERRFQMERGLATADQIAEAKDFIDKVRRNPNGEMARKITAGDPYAKDRWACWHFIAYRCREAPPDYDWSK